MGLSAWLIDVDWIKSVFRFTPDNLRNLIDIGLVLMLIYVMLLVIGERRTLWMLRGFIVLMLATVLSDWLRLDVLHFVLKNLVIGAAVAMSVILQTEFRRFLEQLGKGEVRQLIRPTKRSQPRSTTFTDEIVDAVKELSQKRTGALMILEMEGYIDERDFSVPKSRRN
jgi:DNA integrity scanning protein DisA with diadenylate cyclase activity